MREAQKCRAESPKPRSPDKNFIPTMNASPFANWVVLGALLAFAIPAKLDAQQSATATPAASLVPNGNFESDGAGARWPDGWGKGPGMNWEVENGKHFLRLVSQKAGEIEMLYRAVPIPPGVKGIEITIRYRTAGFSFNRHCGPQVIQDWNYTPAPYCGVFVKAALAGKQFEMNSMR